MKTAEHPQEATLAQRVAGEDLHVDDYVAVLKTTGQFLSCMWDHFDPGSEKIVRVPFIPDDAGTPLKVFAICLPFVYAKRPNDTVATIDLRMTEIVRVDKGIAKAVWKQIKGKVGSAAILP